MKVTLYNKRPIEIELPDSILTKSQTKQLKKIITYEGKQCSMIVTLRYDDQCNNKHNRFSITGEINSIPKRRDCITCGQMPDEIVKYFPKLKHLLKWHLTSSEGPWSYLANSLYFASDRDYNGLKKGEIRQLKDGKTGLPCYELKAVHKVTGEVLETYKLKNYVDSETAPQCEYELKYLPWNRIGEGKEIELDAARKSAVWSDATIEDFTEEKLLERLPSLMKEFKKDMEELGFIY